MFTQHFYPFVCSAHVSTTFLRLNVSWVTYLYFTHLISFTYPIWFLVFCSRIEYSQIRQQLHVTSWKLKIDKIVLINFVFIINPLNAQPPLCSVPQEPKPVISRALLIKQSEVRYLTILSRHSELHPYGTVICCGR